MPPRQIRVLNVAEKPSVAKEITRHLGGGHVDRQNVHGSWVAEFPFTLQHTPCRMVVTAVRGHLLETDFDAAYINWKTHPPAALFQAPVRRRIGDGSADLERMLLQLAPRCQWLVLWLDCDREGEAIAFEVLDTCQRAAGGRLQVFRAVFSALTRQDLTHAVENLRAPDRRLADAVEARSEVDLRAGAAFTRWMTLRYRAMFPELGVLSYGPCQFPTLGFVVERWLRIQRFVPEPFWSMRIDARKDGKTIRFSWRRERLFDHLAVFALYELCLERAADGILVTRVTEEPKTRWRPLPLNTVEMTKLSAAKLRMAPARCMEVAEGLYQRGFISYPRTETDRFGPTIDVRELARTQVTSSVWGGFAQSLVEGGRFTMPRAGTHDDNAHPPIHPVRSAERAELADEQWRVFELVVRHFLACCAPDARGNRTEVEVQVGGESFVTAGLVVMDRGWLEVYPYSIWENNPLPMFVVDEALAVDIFEMTSGHTHPPPLLSEADLISLMDRTGIGTDATMHDHIQKIQTRNYAMKNQEGRLEPSKLGVALVEGYQRFAVEEGLDLSKPALRAQMESGMNAIAQGQRDRAEFLEWCVGKASSCYSALERNAPALDAELEQHFTGRAAFARAGAIVQNGFSRCRCGSSMDLRHSSTDAPNGGDPASGGGPAGGGPAGGGTAVVAAGGRAGRGRGRASRGRGGRGAAGHGRGRGGRRGRGGAGLAAGSAQAQRGPRSARFLVCSSPACGMVLGVPSKSEQTLTPFGHTCPICNFQVLNVRNTETNREHRICPYCFNFAPQDLHPGAMELRCFQCSHLGCALAGGRSSGSGGCGGGGPGRPGGGGVPLVLGGGASLLACAACATPSAQLVLCQRDGRWCIQCTRQPACSRLQWLPRCVVTAAVEGQCFECSERLQQEVRTMSLRLAGALLPNGEDLLRGVCIGGCSDMLARLGA